MSDAADPPNARITPAVRAEIARSGETAGVLARRFGVNTETVRKRRKRGPGDCLDRSLDDLTFVVAHLLPHLNRDSVWRILRAEGG